jgi:3-hydroxyisobutyrate dehydrogenase-like beta-hydroxyacid dehydrogenase
MLGENDMEVGFIGLGHMGLPMARNLLKAGHRVHVYNRTRSRGELLREDGAIVADTPADACLGGAVITMLANDEAVEEVVFGSRGILRGLRKGGTHISMSTITVALSERLLEAHRAAGQDYVAAPVFGRPEAAAAAKLFIVAAGEIDVIAEFQPLFETLGQRTFVLSKNPPEANLVKLSGNFLIASMIESLGEAFALMRKYGVDPHRFLEIMTESLFAAPIYKTYGTLIADEKYQPAGFRLELGLKDVRSVLAAAEAKAVPMAVASIVRDHFISAIARGGADLDWSGLARVPAEEAGL